MKKRVCICFVFLTLVSVAVSLYSPVAHRLCVWVGVCQLPCVHVCRRTKSIAILVKPLQIFFEPWLKKIIHRRTATWSIFMQEIHADEIFNANSWRAQVRLTYIVATGSGIVSSSPPEAPLEIWGPLHACVWIHSSVTRRSINLFLGNRRSGRHFIPM